MRIKEDIKAVVSLYRSHAEDAGHAEIINQIQTLRSLRSLRETISNRDNAQKVLFLPVTFSILFLQVVPVSAFVGLNIHKTTMLVPYRIQFLSVAAAVSGSLCHICYFILLTIEIGLIQIGIKLLPVDGRAE